MPYEVIVHVTANDFMNNVNLLHSAKKVCKVNSENSSSINLAFSSIKVRKDKKDIEKKYSRNKCSSKNFACKIILVIFTIVESSRFILVRKGPTDLTTQNIVIWNHIWIVFQEHRLLLYQNMKIQFAGAILIHTYRILLWLLFVKSRIV